MSYKILIKHCNDHLLLKFSWNNLHKRWNLELFYYCQEIKGFLSHAKSKQRSLKQNHVVGKYVTLFNILKIFSFVWLSWVLSYRQLCSLLIISQTPISENVFSYKPDPCHTYAYLLESTTLTLFGFPSWVLNCNHKSVVWKSNTWAWVQLFQCLCFFPSVLLFRTGTWFVSPWGILCMLTIIQIVFFNRSSLKTTLLKCCKDNFVQ